LDWRPYFQTFVGFTQQNDALLARSTVEALFVLVKLLLVCVPFGSVFEPKRYVRLQEVADFVSFGPRWQNRVPLVFENLMACQREV
jgi:hypothetical protein